MNKKMNNIVDTAKTAINFTVTDNADEYNLSKPEDKKFLKTDRKFLSEIGSLMKKQNLISHASSLYTGFKAYQMGYFSIDDYEADDPFCELCSGCGRCS